LLDILVVLFFVLGDELRQIGFILLILKPNAQDVLLLSLDLRPLEESLIPLKKNVTLFAKPAKLL